MNCPKVEFIYSILSGILLHEQMTKLREGAGVRQTSAARDLMKALDFVKDGGDCLVSKCVAYEGASYLVASSREDGRPFNADVIEWTDDAIVDAIVRWINDCCESERDRLEAKGKDVWMICDVVITIESVEWDGSLRLTIELNDDEADRPSCELEIFSAANKTKEAAHD